MIDKENLKSKIEARIAKLTEEVAQPEDMTRPISPGVAIGRISRLDAINNKSVLEVSLRSARQKLLSLCFALKHIDNDDFGLGRRCKLPIPEGRILLLPESGFCVNCSK